MSPTSRNVHVTASALVALAIGAGMSGAQSRQFGGVGLTIFDDVNFQGASVTLLSDVPDLRDFNFNDRISSLQAAPGEAWEVCENAGYSGRCVVINGGERDLRAGGWNDAVSSVRRVQSRQGGGFRQYRGGAGITVSDDVNFQGATVSFRGDVPDLREFNLNDRISSVQVAPGEFWEVCQDANFGGRCVVLSGSENDLRARGWNDAITSMRRVEGRLVGGDRDDRRSPFISPGAPRGRIVFFDRPGYRGTALNLNDAAPGLGGFINRAQSAQILDGVWELCEEIRWGGRCVRIAGSVPDLSRVGLRGIASARPVGQER